MKVVPYTIEVDDFDRMAINASYGEAGMAPHDIVKEFLLTACIGAIETACSNLVASDAAKASA